MQLSRLSFLLSIVLIGGCSCSEKQSPPRIFTVTASGSHATSSPSGAVTVTEGAAQAFTVVAETNYTRVSAVGGNCAPGTWDGDTYTTGAITSDCSITFSAAINVFTVTPSGTNVTLSPEGAQSVEAAGKATFAVAAQTGYTRDATVLGTCPQGSWNNNSYTTGAITENCTVKFGAALNTYPVTPSGTNVTISPQDVQTVNHGATLALTVTADTGYTISQTVGGTCPAGSWNGGVYTTGAIVGACSIEFGATLNTYVVTTSGDHLTIDPEGAQSVTHGGTLELDVTAAEGYTLSQTVNGTCPEGNWTDDTYTTGVVAENCTVEFSATLNSYTVTSSGTNMTISPSGDQMVNYGNVFSFTVATGPGYTLSPTVGGTCPAGSWNGNVYTTGPIVGACGVEFGATLNSYVVSSSGSNMTISPAGDQSVNHGSTLALTVTAAANYTRSDTVTGTCAAGSWSGNVYTTGLITGPCTVQFSATLNSYTVTSSGSHVTISPSGNQTVNHGSTLALTVTGSTGYNVSTTVGGTCPAGSWSGSVYTTGAITGACSVSFSGTLKTYSLSASGTNMSVGPSTTPMVNHGSTYAFTVTPNANYVVSTTVGGTCPAGSWSGNVYTTGAITANCTVTFSGLLRVTITGLNLTTSPADGVAGAAAGSSLSITVTPASGFSRSNAVQSSCGSGTWLGNTYTITAVNSACTINFTVHAVYVYVGGSGAGGSFGSRATMAQACQNTYTSTTGYSKQMCTHFAPLLGYTPSGVNDLTNTPYSLPTSYPFTGPSGVVMASTWNGFVNLSNPRDPLYDAGILSYDPIQNRYAVTGFNSGGSVADNCSNWTDPNGDSVTLWTNGWNDGGDFCDRSLKFLCLCWGD